MYKIFYNIALIFLFCSCSTAQSSHHINQEFIQLIDTVIDGDQIRMNIFMSDTMGNISLQVEHNNLIDTLVLKDYSDTDFKDALLYMNKENRIINTWMAKTNNLIIFVLPHYPSIGLYAYKIDNNKINFVTTTDNQPIYSDYAFYAQFNSDMITSCYQPSARNICGATIWEFVENQNKFEKVMTTANDTYLTTDSVKFIHLLDSIYSKKIKISINDKSSEICE